MKEPLFFTSNERVAYQISRKEIWSTLILSVISTFLFVESQWLTSIVFGCIFGLLILVSIPFSPKSFCSQKFLLPTLFAVISCAAMVLHWDLYPYMIGVVFLSVIVLRLRAIVPPTDSLRYSVARILLSVITVPVEWIFAFAAIFNPIDSSNNHNQTKRFPPVLVWGIPLLLGFLFLYIFSFVNPWLNEFKLYLLELLKNVNIKKDILTCIFFVLFYSAMRLTLVRRAQPFFSDAPAPKFLQNVPKSDMVAPMFFNGLILFNLIFLFQNFTDIYYFCMGSRPFNLYLSQYSYYGIYSLTTAVFLAAIFTIIAFTQRDDTAIWKKIQLFVYLWLGQSFVLVLSCGDRLYRYIDYFGYTPSRLFGYAFLVLVSIGLITIIAFVIRKTTISHLLRLNLTILLFWSVIISLFSLQGFCDKQNYKRHFETERTSPIASFNAEDFYTPRVIWDIIRKQPEVLTPYDIELYAKRMGNYSNPEGLYLYYEIERDSEIIQKIIKLNEARNAPVVHSVLSHRTKKKSQSEILPLPKADSSLTQDSYIDSSLQNQTQELKK